MKTIAIFLLLPLLTFGQADISIEKTIKLKLAVMQNFIKLGDKGEETFWQTKGKITFGIVNYTDQQNPIFKALFISQYQELFPIYKKMIVSEDERDTALYIKTLIRQEDDYRNLLSKEQLVLYKNKLNDMEKNDVKAFESFISLFFSDSLLQRFKSGFGDK